MVSIAGTNSFTTLMQAQSRTQSTTASKAVDAPATEIRDLSYLVPNASDSDELIYDRVTLPALRSEASTETGASPLEPSVQHKELSRPEQIASAIARAIQVYEQAKASLSTAGIDISVQSPEAVAMGDALRIQQGPELVKSLRISQSVANHTKLLLQDKNLDAERREVTENLRKTSDEQIHKTIQTIKQLYEVSGELVKTDEFGYYLPSDYSLSYKGRNII